MAKHFYKIVILVFCTLFAKAQTPTATIVAPSATLCSSKSLTFTSITTNTPTAYSWSISPTASVGVLPDKTSPTIVLTFSNSGVYVLSLNVSNSFSNSTTTKTITVTKSAKASFNASLTSIGFPNQLNLTNYSTNALSYNWLFSDVAAVDNNINTVKSYTASGSYSVTLISFGALGCNDTSRYAFRLADSSSIYLPNVFTPNNDSVNDIFKPITRGIKELNVWIYNRYGVIIFSSDKVNSFWDGYTTSGEPCQSGIYFCVAEAIGFDGKTYKLKGNLTLIK